MRQAVAPDPTTFRLVTLNTWKCDGAYKLRLQAMATQLRALAPDFLALQESFSSLDATHNTARDLARAFNLHWVELPSRSKLRWVDGELLPSHSGLAFLSRWPITRHLAVVLPSTAEDGDRVALICQLQIGAHGLTVANVHLTHLENQDGLRHAQLEAVLSHPWLEATSSVAIVCGDFNAPLNGASLRDFMAPRGSWADAALASGLSGKVTCPGAPTKEKDIDHVLSSSASRLLWTRACTALEQPDPATGVMPSDHHAVCVDGRFLP